GANPVELLRNEVRRVRLGSLGQSDAEELVGALLGRDDPTDAAAIIAEAAGHPMFLQELARHASVHGRRLGVLQLDAVLMERVAELPAPARRLLQFVAVAGNPISQDVVARAASLDPGEFSSALALLRVQNLAQSTGARGVDSVLPYHDRVREAMVASLGPDAVREVHRDLALALEATLNPDAEDLALHWREAGDAERAVTYALQAAEAAERALAFGHAAGLYRRALDLGAPDVVRAKLGDALANAGLGAEAAETYLLAVRGAPPVEALELRRRAAEQLLRSGYIDRGLGVIREVLAAAGLSYPKTPFRALLSLVFCRILIRLRGVSFRLRHEGQIAPEVLARIDTCWSVASVLNMVDHIRGADFNGRLLLMSLAAGEPIRLVCALASEGMNVSLSGGRTEVRADHLLAATETLASSLDDPRPMAWLYGSRGVALYHRGQWAKALDELEKGEVAFRDRCRGVIYELDTVRLFRLLSLTFLGRIAEIAVLVPALLAEALDRGDLYCATNLRLTHLNMAWLVDGNVNKAREVAREAAERWSRSGFHVQHWFEYTARLQIGLYAGEADDTYAYASSHWNALVSSQLLRVQNVYIEAYHLRARAALAAAEGYREPRRRGLVREAERYARRILSTRMAWGKALAD
ncbi:MAG: hypothetical protein WCI05_18515, partial [Myxococcales bacterium]